MEGQLRAWYSSTDKADWSSFADVRANHPSADQVGEKLVFNIAGNRVRLVVAIDYVRKGVLVKWVGTHAEYDKIEVSKL